MMTKMIGFCSEMTSLMYERKTVHIVYLDFSKTL